MRGIIQSALADAQNSKWGTASAVRPSATRAWARLKRKSSLSGCRATAAANCSTRDGIASDRVDDEKHAGRVVRTAASHRERNQFFQDFGRLARLAQDRSELGVADHPRDAIRAKKVAIAGLKRARNQVDVRRRRLTDAAGEGVAIGFVIIDHLALG